MDETINIGSFPLEIALFVICGTDVRVEKEVAGILVWPVFWDCEFGLAGFYSRDEGLEIAVFTDEFEGCVGTNFGNGVEVIAA